MINALVIILGMLVTLMSLTDGHSHSNGTPTITLSKFLLIFGCSAWFFSVVLSFAEEIELEEEGNIEANRIKSCTYVAKNGQDIVEKSPPYYDC